MQTIRIFISSPGDVAKERQRAREVIDSLRRRYAHRFYLQPVFWEDLPLQPDMSFQQGIDVVISEQGVDIAVFILWSRLGSPVGSAIPKPDGSEYRSGTEREYDLMMRARALTRESEGKARPAILVYTRRDETSFEEQLRGKPTAEKKSIINQKGLLESFIHETFKDQETGANIGAYFPFDRPVTFSKRLRVHLQELLDPMAGEMDQVIWDTDKQGPPFLGLETFQPEHSTVFFGREEEILEARNALKYQALNGCAFLLLSGASGSGKSSIARAGLLPAVVENEIDDQVAAWSTLILTPADLVPDPIAALVARLAADSHFPALSGDTAEIVAGLKENSELTFRLRIKDAIRKGSEAADGPVRLLLIFDQLEEWFTSASPITIEQRKAFLDVVETFARSGSAWVIATVRSDFYQQIQSEPALVRMKSGRGQLDLMPPGPAALTRMIEEPALLAGLSFEKLNDQSLSDRILKDAASHAELLPLVEFVLRELYDRQSEKRQLTFAAYEDLGGVEGALAKRAEETYAALYPDVQAALGRVLESLVTLGQPGTGNGDDIDKPVRQHAPLSIFSATPEAKLLVDRFIEARLFTTGYSNATSEPTVTVAHESLLRVWPRTKAWVDQNRDFLRIRARVAARMTEGCLLLDGDPLLESAKSFLTTQAEGFSREQREWLERAVSTVAAKREKIAHRRQLVLVSLIALTLAATIGAIVAYQQRLHADKARMQETAAKDDAVAKRKVAEYQSYIANISAANAALTIGETNAAQLYLSACPESLRNWEWRYLTASCEQSILTFRGKSAHMLAAAYNPGGSRIVTGGENGEAIIWDAHTGNRLLTLGKHEGSVVAVAYSPDGRRIATASRAVSKGTGNEGENAARIWDATTGKLVRTFQHQAPVNALAWRPDGKCLVTASGNINASSQNILGSRDECCARIWDVDTGRQILNLVADNGAVISVAFSSDGRRIATGEFVNMGRIWDATSGEQLAVLSGGAADPFHSVAFSPDGARVISASGSTRAVNVWDTVTGKMLAAHSGHMNSVMAVAFSHDGLTIASGCGDGILRRWDEASGKWLSLNCGHKKSINSVNFSPDDANIITASQDGMAKLWHTDASWSFPVLRGHQGAVCSAEFSPDDRSIVTASGNWELNSDLTARIWHSTTGKPQAVLQGHEESVNSAAYSPDGRQIVTASNDKTARIWDSATGKQLMVLHGHSGDVASASFSPNGKHIVTASGGWYSRPPWSHGSDQTVRVWDADKGNELLVIPFSTAPVNWAAFSPDGTRIITTAGRYATAITDSVIIWDAQTGQQLVALRGHSQSVFSAAWSSDGTRIVTASWDNTARVWDAVSGIQLLAPLKHNAWVLSAAFSPDGSRIVTAAGDQTARIWDATTGIQLLILLDHQNTVNSARFSHDGTRIVTASKDGTARVWDSTTREKRHQELLEP